MGIAPMSRNVFQKYSTSLVCLDENWCGESKRNPPSLPFCTEACGSKKSEKAGLSQCLTPEIPYWESGVRWPASIATRSVAGWLWRLN
jgi:hypothetical protein